MRWERRKYFCWRRWFPLIWIASHTHCRQFSQRKQNDFQFRLRICSKYARLYCFFYTYHSEWISSEYVIWEVKRSWPRIPEILHLYFTKTGTRFNQKILFNPDQWCCHLGFYVDKSPKLMYCKTLVVTKENQRSKANSSNESSEIPYYRPKRAMCVVSITVLFNSWRGRKCCTVSFPHSKAGCVPR